MSDMIVPPGELLLEELQARKMSQVELARQMKRPPQTINAIIKGKKRITARSAIELEAVLGISALFWMRLDISYWLAVERLARDLEVVMPSMEQQWAGIR